MPKKYYNRINNVHSDDIHGLLSWEDFLISGSKDTTVRQFTHHGEYVKDLVRHSPSHSYERWITGMDFFPGNGSLVIGSRNGYLHHLSISGKPIAHGFLNSFEEYQGEFSGKQGKAKPVYKSRNETRITGIKCISNAATDFRALVGVPEEFFEIDCPTGTIISSYRFDAPEWVYGFSQLAPGVIVAIHGCQLSVFKKNEGGQWRKTNTLVEEDQMAPLVAQLATASLKEPVPSAARSDDDGFQLVSSKKSASLFKPARIDHKAKRQRPFISHVTSFDPVDDTKIRQGWLALAFFGGINQIIDTEKNKVIHSGNEHRERVWQSVPFSSNIYATCADDATVKIWDIRQQGSVKTYSEHPGRVSALCFLGGNKFVAGTCAADPHSDPNQAQFYFYDLSA